jgi:hypothetical protein
VDYWGNYDTVDDSGARVAHDGILKSLGGWPVETGSIKITYWGGYTCDELRGDATVLDASPIFETALYETVRRVKETFIINQKKSGIGFLPGVLESERLGDYSYKIGGAGGGNTTADRNYGNTRAFTSQSREALESFVNYGWPVFS